MKPEGRHEHAGHGGASSHADHRAAPSHADHGGHGGHDKHAGHSPAMFRNKFWLCLALTIPALIWGHMLQSALGYSAPVFPGSHWIPALFGTAVFAIGGWPFVHGAFRELLDRRPGMMTLIALAISVLRFSVQSPGNGDRLGAHAVTIMARQWRCSIQAASGWVPTRHRYGGSGVSIRALSRQF